VSSAPTLEVDDIHKRFGDLEVLKGISLTAHDGDVISLIGSSGSGKSTFLRCINFLEMPDRGTVRLSGQAVEVKQGRRGPVANERHLQALRTRLGFVFQSFNLWPHMTILENVIEAPMRVKGLSRPDAIALAESLLAKVGIANKRHTYPSHMSGGQQQRAAIARALTSRPRPLTPNWWPKCWA
jgi:polar amino acid transport system ATP-binding protein